MKGFHCVSISVWLYINYQSDLLQNFHCSHATRREREREPHNCSLSCHFFLSAKLSSEGNGVGTRRVDSRLLLRGAHDNPQGLSCSDDGVVS